VTKPLLVQLCRLPVELPTGTRRPALLRGIDAEEFDAVQGKHGQAKQGVLRQGVEMRMFIMLALRLSAGAENLERMRVRPGCMFVPPNTTPLDSVVLPSSLRCLRENTPRQYKK